MTDTAMTDATLKRAKSEPKRMLFTDAALRKMKPPEAGQGQWWDSGTGAARGLSVLASAGGTKSYMATFQLNGKYVTAKLGRVGELGLADARERTRQYRARAKEGIDPRPNKQPEPEPVQQLRYRDVVDQFIDLYAKPRQRTWDQTQRALTQNCAAWADREFTSISKKDAYALLDAIVKEGHGPTAALTLAWLKKLWRWAGSRDIVQAPIMDLVTIDYTKQVRDRVWSDDEIKAIWHAAETLGDAPAGAFVKLLVLTAARKSALAMMQHADLKFADDGNPVSWTTPFEATKSRKTAKPREYQTPLPPLAQRILRPHAERTGGAARVFALPLCQTQAGRPYFNGSPLTKRLIAAGAPRDFTYHTARHTLATWLQTQGHSEWECGLVLNHAGSGSVTAGYSHGYPTALKLAVLTKWADHVERLVTPHGVPLPARASAADGPVGHQVAE
jgi:integrase